MNTGEIIAELGGLLKEQGLFLGTAESCTGGLIASTLTDVSGSSEWFKGAVVSYANEVKINCLKVPAKDIEENGAVSEPVVRAMARGVMDFLNVDAAVAVSGVAGPTGGTPDKPVGTVWMAFAGSFGVKAARFNFLGSRSEVKQATVDAACDLLLKLLKDM